MGSCSEILFLAMFSSSGMAMNIVLSIYNYFVATHPLCILFCCVLGYILLSFYISCLGRLIKGIDKPFNRPSDNIDKYTNLIYTEIYDPNEEKEKVDTQTKKSTSLRFQKENTEGWGKESVEEDTLIGKGNLHLGQEIM